MLIDIPSHLVNKVREIIHEKSNRFDNVYLEDQSVWKGRKSYEEIKIFLCS